MQVLSAKPPSSPENQAPRRGRKPGKPLTARELAARRANLVKARAAYRPTKKRLRASRANFEKAMAARRSPEGNAAARLNALKHGLFAKHTLAESVDRLGEDKEEFDRHLRLCAHFFTPEDEEEKRIVRGLADTVWRRLRFFHAQAFWEKERLHRMLREAPPPPADEFRLDDTVARAEGVALALMELDPFFRELNKLQSQAEFWLRKLIRKRSEGKVRWKGFRARRDPGMREIEKDEQVSRFVEIWDAMSPEEQAAALEEARKKVDAQMAEWERVQAPSNPRRG